MLKQTKHLIKEIVESSDSCNVSKLTTTKRLALQKEIKTRKVTYYEWRYASKERVVWQDPEALEYGWLWKIYEDKPKEALIEEMTRITLDVVKHYKKKTILLEADYDGKSFYGFIKEDIDSSGEVVMFGYMYEDLD